MKRNSIRAIMGLVVLVTSLAASLAFTTPQAQATSIRVNDGYGYFAEISYQCLGRGVVSMYGDLVSTGPQGTQPGIVYFQTHVERLTNSGWVNTGLVWTNPATNNWITAGIGGWHQRNFPVGYGKVRFMTTYAAWNNAQGRYQYFGPYQELFLWSNGLVFGDSYTCTL